MFQCQECLRITEYDMGGVCGDKSPTNNLCLGSIVPMQRELSRESTAPIHPSTVSTWADGTGTWHARVPRGAASPLLAARRAIRSELSAREDLRTIARSVWTELQRCPDLDSGETIVYREGEARLTLLDLEPRRCTACDAPLS